MSDRGKPDKEKNYCSLVGVLSVLILVANPSLICYSNHLLMISKSGLILNSELGLSSDISEVRVEGFETLDYLDNLCSKERFTEQGNTLTLESEVDRVYLSTRNAVAV
ncbi:glucose-6-phosphate 1-epimerase [Salvia divinorum]|uniref:Glucose-6-phosphate 1-epimerase n=1 Tax=Salvia divinorum TaxID=28513 RepID=A0ABD1FM59_SALDI